MRKIHSMPVGITDKDDAKLIAVRDRPQPYNCREQDFVNYLNELGSRSFSEIHSEWPAS